MADRRSSPPREPSRCALIGCGVELLAAADRVGAKTRDPRHRRTRRARRRTVRPWRRVPDSYFIANGTWSEIRSQLVDFQGDVYFIANRTSWRTGDRARLGRLPDARSSDAVLKSRRPRIAWVRRPRIFGRVGRGAVSSGPVAGCRFLFDRKRHLGPNPEPTR
ncbi:MAG: hypothetical protein M2R45_05456 [Verrucomicrobia subdivision 3 bacterium]|nr:hypothetical protein [Limisphaerales bacterium]